MLFLLLILLLLLLYYQYHHHNHHQHFSNYFRSTHIGPTYMSTVPQRYKGTGERTENIFYLVYSNMALCTKHIFEANDELFCTETRRMIFISHV